MAPFGSRNPVIYVVPFIVVASLIVIVTLLRHGRRVYTWSRFNQYQGTVQPRYDLPVHRAQQRPFTEPFYPVMPYGSTAPAQPPPVVTMSHHRATATAPVTVPVSNAPTITPYIPDSASIMERNEVIREAGEERYLPPPSYEYAAGHGRV